VEQAKGKLETEGVIEPSSTLRGVRRTVEMLLAEMGKDNGTIAKRKL
jgi:hypothetical protein